jgi:hypothetical protein
MQMTGPAGAGPTKTGSVMRRDGIHNKIIALLWKIIIIGIYQLFYLPDGEKYEI